MEPSWRCYGSTMDFLNEAKKAYWAAGCRKTPDFRDRLRMLLLDKLERVGRLDEDDLVWVETQVERFRP